MDRIHRLGQRRPVQAIKLVIEDSIESRIVQLQEKKSAMVDATLSTDDSVGDLRPVRQSSLMARYRRWADSLLKMYVLLSLQLCCANLRGFLAVLFIQSILIFFYPGNVSTYVCP